jgi:uncharacterized protein (TIGR03435 family)
MKLIRLGCAILAIVSVLLCNSLFAQAPAKPAFEVASIKPAPTMQTLIADIQSGKRSIASIQTVDATRVDLGYVPLNSLLAMAYKVKAHQIAGPDWLGSQAFEIHAKIPEGVSKEQLPDMMQALLMERFNLTTHWEKREQPVYALIVSKDGHKLKEASAGSETTAPAEDPAKTPTKKIDGKGEELSINTPDGPMKMKREGNGIIIDSGQTGKVSIKMGESGMSMEFAKLKISEFADLLSQFVDRPVVDMTDLKGSYQLALDIPMEEMMSMVQKLAPKLGISLPPGLGGSGTLVGAAPGASGLGASDPSGSGIFRAIQKLGLKLDGRKEPVNTLVIDHIEKTPTED